MKTGNNVGAGFMVELFRQGSSANLAIDFCQMRFTTFPLATLFRTPHAARAAIEEWAETLAEYELVITEHIFA